MAQGDTNGGIGKTSSRIVHANRATVPETPQVGKRRPASPQSRQRRRDALGLGGVVGMIGTRFFDRLGLGFLDEAGVAKPSGERGGFLLRGGLRLFEAGLFGGDIDHATEGDQVGYAFNNDLCRSFSAE